MALLAGSSVLSAWGNAGEYTLLSQLSGPQGRLAANSLYSAQVSLAVIVGPALAGVLLAPLGIGSLLAVDAASFAFLGIQAWRTRLSTSTAEEPASSAAAESGFRQLRRLGLMSLIILTWLFFFLYGPVEDALPVYVSRELHASAGLLGAYWTSFGAIGAADGELAGIGAEIEELRSYPELARPPGGQCARPIRADQQCPAGLGHVVLGRFRSVAQAPVQELFECGL